MVTTASDARSAAPMGLDADALFTTEDFANRHIGPTSEDEVGMLAVIGVASRQALVEALLPPAIARAQPMDLPPPVDEATALAELRALAQRNKRLRSFIGQGYFGTHTPGVILRNILENPAWYTAYTPYQAEISQGRLEALVNFQTLVTDLSGMAVANASMLDEATAAAEAMTLALRAGKSPSSRILVAHDVLPQTLALLQTRARPLSIEVEQVHTNAMAQALAQAPAFAVLLQYPGVNGQVRDLRPLIAAAHAHGALAIVGADLLALTLLIPPGEMGADIAFGSTQRLGMPMGAGGPHAAYLATQDALKRSLPGRLVGLSVDAAGANAYRLALQTREQHIRREKATSNICTAQVLPAVVASMFAVYHGPQGLKTIALRIAGLTAVLAAGLKQMGWHLLHNTAFDTVQVEVGNQRDALMAAARQAGANLRAASADTLGISLDETSTAADLELLWGVFSRGGALPDAQRVAAGLAAAERLMLPPELLRISAFLTHPVFNRYHSETEMLR